MTRSALITGAAGFIGRNLAAFLLEQGIQSFGLDRPTAARPSDWTEQWFEGDITDAERIFSIVREVEPYYVFHLAALIKTESLADLLAVNVIGTQCLLDVVEKICPQARVLIAGTSAEYGLARPEELPIREENPLRPLSPYGVSKVAQSLLAAQYAYRHGLNIIRTRTFNLIGPGEPETLVCSAFAKQIVQIKLGLRPPLIEVGNLEAERDFLDVRDAVRAYWMAAEKGESGQVYNICSGSSVSIRKLLETLIDLANIHVQVNHTPARFTKWDVPDQIGEPDRLRNLTGWAPTFTLQRSLEDLLDDWQNRISAP